MRTTKWVSEGTTGVASESLVRTTRLVHSPRCRRVLVSSLSCLHCPRHGAGPSWLGGGEGDTKLEEAHDTQSHHTMGCQEVSGGSGDRMQRQACPGDPGGDPPSKRCSRRRPGKSSREVQVHGVKGAWAVTPCPAPVPFSSSHSSRGLMMAA